jgi:hypothetical protein
MHNIGREPEAVKAGSDQLKQRATAYKPEKLAAFAGEGEPITAHQPAYLRNIIH